MISPESGGPGVQGGRIDTLSPGVSYIKCTKSIQYRYSGVFGVAEHVYNLAGVYRFYLLYTFTQIDPVVNNIKNAILIFFQSFFRMFEVNVPGDDVPCSYLATSKTP